MANKSTSQQTPTEIYLVRHLKTPWNVSSRLQGQRDIAICDTREEEEQKKIDKNRAALNKLNFDAVFVSPLQRTHQTAQLHGYDAPQVLAEMLEIDFGPFEGVVKSQMTNEQLHLWKHAPQNLKLGEDFDVFTARVQNVLEMLAQPSYARVLLFGHGAWLRCFSCLAKGQSPTTMNSFSINNGDLLRINYPS